MADMPKTKIDNPNVKILVKKYLATKAMQNLSQIRGILNLN